MSDDAIRTHEDELQVLHLIAASSGLAQEETQRRNDLIGHGRHLHIPVTRLAGASGLSPARVKQLPAVPELPVNEPRRSPRISGWVRSFRGHSEELIRLHGIPFTLPTENPNTSAAELHHLASGARLLIYTQTRWNGLRGPSRSDDHRGRYLIERCPARSGDCASTHRSLSITDIGLEEGDDLYGIGWVPERDRDGACFTRILAALGCPDQLM